MVETLSNVVRIRMILILIEDSIKIFDQDDKVMKHGLVDGSVENARQTVGRDL